MKFSLLVSLLLFAGLFMNAQNDYKAGLILNNHGDTVRGWINYKGWRINPRKIDFKTSPDKPDADQLTVNDIQYFEIPGADAYVKAIVVKDMRTIRQTEITAETTDTTQTDTVFLRILVRGSRLNLYEFVDFKEHYYLQEAGGQPQELLFKVYPAEKQGFVSVRFLFRDQLEKYLIAYNATALQSQIDYARYEGKDLSKIIIGLNGTDQKDAIQYSAHEHGLKLQLFAGVGASFSTLGISGTPSVALATDNFNTSFDPTAAIGLDLLSSRMHNDFTFRFEVDYSRSSHKGQQDVPNTNIPGLIQHETYELDQQSVSPSLSVLYNFRRLRKVKYYIGLGYAVNFTSYSKNRYSMTYSSAGYPPTSQDNYLDLNKAWPSFFLRVGSRISQKFAIDLSGAVNGSLDGYAGFSVNLRTYSAKLLYFFL